MEIDSCKVYYESRLAGFLVRANSKEKKKYYFAYDERYLQSSEAKALSISLPLKKEPFEADRLFPFFEGLLSEGWLRKVQSENQKIDERDSFALLAKNGGDLIGAVTIELMA